jgi:hypothetical protein
MTKSKHHLAKSPPLESQKLAWDFANEVANERLSQVDKILEEVKNGKLLPVDALFEIRVLVSSTSLAAGKCNPN